MALGNIGLTRNYIDELNTPDILSTNVDGVIFKVFCSFYESKRTSNF